MVWCPIRARACVGLCPGLAPMLDWALGAPALTRVLRRFLDVHRALPDMLGMREGSGAGGFSRASDTCESRSETSSHTARTGTRRHCRIPWVLSQGPRVSLSSVDVLSLLEEFIMKTVYQPAESRDSNFSFSDPRQLGILRPRDVCLRTTLSVAHIHRLQHDHRFPLYGRYAGRVCGVYEHVMDAWFAGRIAARPAMAPLGLRPPLPVWTFRVEDVPHEVGIHLLRRREVLALVGFGRTQLYRLIAEGRFPRPVPLGALAARWVASEVQSWLRARRLSDPSPRVPSSAPASSSSLLHKHGVLGGEPSDQPFRSPPV